MREGRDPRINWKLGWKELKKALKGIQKNRDEEERNRTRLRINSTTLECTLGWSRMRNNCTDSLRS